MPPAKDFLTEVQQWIPDFNRSKYRPDLIDTSVAVSNYLQNGAALMPRFQMLERAMQLELNARIQRATPYVSPAFRQRAAEQVAGQATGKPGLPKNQLNVLSTVLMRNEQANDFKLVGQDKGDAKVALVVGFLQAEVFRKMLRDGLPFRDPSVPAGHGEFSHRIQWYLLSAPGGLSPGRYLTWGAFYRWLGRVKHTQIHSDPEHLAPDKGEKERTWLNYGLWDALFDRNKVGRDWLNVSYNTTEVTDFRSPENLHEYIVTVLRGPCPLLSGFVEARDAQWNARRADRLLMLEYVADHLYGRPYDRLTQGEKEETRRVMNDVGVILPGQGALPL